MQQQFDIQITVAAKKCFEYHNSRLYLGLSYNAMFVHSCTFLGILGLFGHFWGFFQWRFGGIDNILGENTIIKDYWVGLWHC